MAILTHGSDLLLAPTIAPLVTGFGTVRRALHALAGAEFRAVQLDATLRGIRPRELDHRARKDMLALLNRSEIRLAGLDLFLPRKHFIDSEHMDRAMQATLGAIELAADLGRVPVSLSLPVKAMSDDLKNAIVQAADGRDVRLAAHAEDQFDELRAWVKQADMPALGVGLDPATLITAGMEPLTICQQLGAKLTVARLNDADRQGGLRCLVGDGELDVIQYRIMLDLAAKRAGPVVLDLRGLADPLHAANTAKHVWDKAAFTT